MLFSCYMLSQLRKDISLYISPKRYEHSIGVERAALKISEFFPEIRKDEASAAALLHDIAKELSYEEQRRLAQSFFPSAKEVELASAQVLHAYAAPAFIRLNFPDFATPAVLSAVYKHTTGDVDMSLLDKVIFLADYIEEGRAYESCIRVREALFCDLASAKSDEELLNSLNKACIQEIDEIILTLKSRNLRIDPGTLATKSAILSSF